MTVEVSSSSPAPRLTLEQLMTFKKQKADDFIKRLHTVAWSAHSLISTGYATSRGFLYSEPSTGIRVEGFFLSDAEVKSPIKDLRGVVFTSYKVLLTLPDFLFEPSASPKSDHVLDLEFTFKKVNDSWTVNDPTERFIGILKECSLRRLDELNMVLEIITTRMQSEFVNAQTGDEDSLNELKPLFGG